MSIYHDQWLNDTIPQLEKRYRERKCGDCRKWNIHQLCPRESGPGLRGRSVGPSMNAYPCPQFEPDASMEAMLEMIVMKKLEQ